MSSTEISCLCGAVKVRLEGNPASQFYCHCDDCQAVHGASYLGAAVFPAHAVTVTEGELASWTYKTLPRKRCAACGTRMLADVPGIEQTGVVANRLPRGMFKPEFHINCRYAVLPVADDLPHFAGFPAAFGGSDEKVDW